MERAYSKVLEGKRVFVATYTCRFQVNGVGPHIHQFTVPWIPRDNESELDIPRVVPCKEHPNRTADLVVQGTMDQK